MKYFPLIWAQLFRSRTRTLLTLLSVITAFMLFGMLDAVRVAFNQLSGKPAAPKLRVAQLEPVRSILEEELDAVWANRKPAKEALDHAVARASSALRAFSDGRAKRK